MGFAIPLLARHGSRPNRVRHPTDQRFTFSCSPLPLARTQLLPVTAFRPNADKDSHPADLIHLQAHNGWPVGPNRKSRCHVPLWIEEPISGVKVTYEVGKPITGVVDEEVAVRLLKKAGVADDAMARVLKAAGVADDVATSLLKNASKPNEQGKP